jgi:hypothetical protein
MAMKCFAAMILLMAAALALSPIVAGGGADPVGPVTWEYKVVGYAEVLERGVGQPIPGKLESPESYKAMSESLTKLGREGWEMVAVESPRTGSMQTYYFKRRK